MNWIAYFAIGLGLSTVAGFRIFIPLFALALAAKFGLVGLNESFSFLSDSGALWILGVALIIETFAYYIPWFDNMMDAISIPLVAVIGTFFLAAILPEGDSSPAVKWGLSALAGGGAATTVGLSTAGIRAASTGSTGGFGNIAFSTMEVFLAIAGTFFIWVCSEHPYVLLSAVFLMVAIAAFVIYMTFRFIRFLFGKIFGRGADGVAEGT